MTLYLQKQQTSAIWPEPIESTWQMLGGDSGCELAPKLPHLGLTDILFMTTIMSLPCLQRPWGMVTWMSDVFLLSRPALYALSDRVKQRLLPTAEPTALTVMEPTGARISVTATRMARTVLTASLPGKTAIRPLRHVLSEAFNQTRSIGWISQLLTEAGQNAGHRLRGIDTSPLGTVIAARDEPLFDEKYVSAVAKEERCYDQHAAFAEWLSHLVDALELVDWRSGEIRDLAINQWLLEETLCAMSTIDQPRVQKWVKTLRRHQKQLLTSLDWLAASLKPYCQQLTQVVVPDQQESFMRTVACHWRLQQALINGHSSFGQQAQAAQTALQEMVANDAQCQQLAENLMTLLDAACRTSSMIEGVNGLLTQFLHNHQAFRSPETLQLYLNLFVLWHNMRVFERGKRQGKSPYQLAGIDPGTDDWLTLLGYPAQ